MEAAIGVLQTAIQKLNSVAVDTVDLRERNRVSNPIEGYTQNVAPREQGLAVHPGQDIEYVVVNDQKSSHDCVALGDEGVDSYDASYYETRLIRAVESILSPLGWERADIRETLAETQEYRLAEF